MQSARLVVVRTDPVTGAFRPPERNDPPSCLATTARGGCVVIPSIPPYSNGASATFSPDGRVLYARNSGTLVVPASNLKLVTMAVAAERLGWDFRYDTRLESAGTVVDGANPRNRDTTRRLPGRVHRASS